MVKKLKNKGLNNQLTKPLTKAEKELLFLISEQHLTLKQIQLRRDCSRQAVYKLLRSLKKKGAINLSLQSQGTCQPKQETRLHCQEFNVKILWQDHRYQNLLLKSNLMRLEGHTIKLFKNSIEIYSGEGISFYGKDEQEADSKSVTYWNKLFNRLEHELKIVIVKDRCRNVKEVNHHYAHTNSEICKNAIENKEQIRVFALEDGKLAFVSDDSFGFREDETLHPITAKEDRKNVDKQVNDWRINNPPTNSELAISLNKGFELMNGIQQNQLIFDKNMKSHLKVLNKIGNAVDNLTKAISKKNIKSRDETQHTLNQYE